MKRFLFILLLGIFVLPFENLACSCSGLTSFCSGLKDINGNFPADLVVLRGIVVADEGSGKTVEVVETIYGEINDNQILLRFSFCSIGFGTLEDGQEYVLSAFKSGDSYLAPSCTTCILELDDEVVTGNIAPGVESMEYLELSSLGDCNGLFQFVELENRVSIFPNPTNGELNFRNRNSESSLSTLIQIYNLEGRLVRDYDVQQSILPSEVWNTDIAELASGIYFVKLISNNQEHTFRIVKQTTN